jgi:hypothetical protein
MRLYAFDATGNVPRSNIALRWMMLHAISRGVDLDPARLPRRRDPPIRWP